MKRIFLFLAGIIYLPALVCGQSEWQITKGPEGGTVYALGRNNNTVYACGSKGVWATTDNGAHWARTTFLSEEEVAVAIYAAGDEIVLASYEVVDEYVYPASISRSTDGGQTWQKTDFDFDIQWSLSWGIPQIWRENNTLWFRSALDDFLKSTDNGASWTPVSSPPVGADDYVQTMAVSGDQVLAYSYYFVWRSSDGGANWQATAQDTTYGIELPYMAGNLLIKTVGDSVFRSDDFGLTWQGDIGNVPGYQFNVFRTQDGRFAVLDGYLWLSDDGLHWQKVSASSAPVRTGVDLGDSFLGGGNYGLYRTVQNNTGFEASNTGFVASTIYCLAATPNGRLVAGAKNGVFLSLNGGQSWQPLPPNGEYYPPVFLTMTAKDNDIWAVTSNDSLYVLRQNSNAWERVIRADGWYAGESFVRVVGDELFLVEDEQIRRSPDNGVTWLPFLTASISDGLRDITKIGDTYFCVNNNGVVSRSSDGGATWEIVQETWSPGAHRSHILPVAGNRLFHFQEDEAWVSDDLGATWKGLAMDGLPVDSWGSIYFEFSSFNLFQNVMVVTLPPHGVYISFDQGNSWESFNAGLTSRYGYAIATRGNTLYYGGSRTGVWQMNSQFEIFSGLVFDDLNDNGQQDAGEKGLENIIVAADPLGSLTQTGPGGAYSLVAASQLDSISITLPSPYSSATPPAYLASQTGGGYDFAVHFTPNIVDLTIDLVNWSPFRPGFDNTLTMTVKNIGTVTAENAVAVCVLPGELHYGVAFAPPGTTLSVTNDSLIWEINQVLPMQSIALDIQVTVESNTVLGSQLIVPAAVQIASDANPANNEFRLAQTVVGSYDPNDKQAAGRISPEEIAAGKPIEYTIRFENTGTFYAEKVVITDQLESDLDASTFRFISSSHPCTWRVKNGGLVEFVFENMFLFPEETGFVKFSVEADRDLALNEVVSNTAEIVFDFNTPIITNTVETTVQYPTGTSQPAGGLYQMTVWPNPASTSTRVQVPSGAAEPADRLVVSDESGRTVRVFYRPAWPLDLKVADLNSGAYELRLSGKTGRTLAVGKLVVVH